MLTTKEKRFIKYWEEQRTGGRLSYFALFIPVGTFLCGILTTFVFSIVTFMEGNFFLIVSIVSALLSTIIVTATWFNNEKKFRRIIQREVLRGKEMDEAGSDGATEA